MIFAPSEDEIKTAAISKDLQIYRSEVLASGNIAYLYRFDDIPEFKARASRSISDLTRDLEQRQLGGWIRSEIVRDKYVERQRVHPQMLISKGLNELVSPLCEMDEVFPNLDVSPDLKLLSARALLNFLSSALSSDEGVRRLFIDGGSSTYFFCKGFNDYCRNSRAYLNSKTPNEIVVATNSIMNFIELVSNSKTAIRLYKSLRFYPAPPISKIYGKSFGNLEDIPSVSESVYQNRGWELGEEAKKILARAVSEFKWWLTHSRVGWGLSILSAAGFRVSGDHTGPWVKDHLSMLQQRGIFMAGQPTILLLNDNKWDTGPVPHQGYPVLFGDMSWDDVVREQPTGVVVTVASLERGAAIESYFAKLGMSVTHFPSVDDNGDSVISYLAVNRELRGMIENCT